MSSLCWSYLVAMRLQVGIPNTMSGKFGPLQVVPGVVESLKVLIYTPLCYVVWSACSQSAA